MANEPITEFMKAKFVQKLLLCAIAEPMIYRSWSLGYRLKSLGEAMDDIRGKVGEGIDISGFTSEECDALSFGLWSDEPDDPAFGLRVMPIWLYPYLKPGQVLIGIDGSKDTVGTAYTDDTKPGYIDNDHRGGFLAYGIVPKLSLVKATSIPLTTSEIQSGLDRVKWAEGLIKQLPNTHEGRNSWLANFGRNAE